MDLSSSIVKKFVNLTKQDTESAGSYFYGTGIVNGDTKYVQLDGSDSVTSVSLASDLETGDRVLVYIEDHQASVIGNITYPSSGRGVIDVTNRLQDFEELVVGDFYAVTAEIQDIYSNYVSTQYLETYYLTAEYILSEYTATEELVATYATIDNLAVLKEYVDSLEANEITVEYLDAHYADIESLAALQVTVGILEANYANIDTLLANYAKISDLEVTNENVANLTADYSDIKYILAGYEVVEDLQSIHLTSDNVVIDNAVIQDAMIANVSADKITAGTIYTSLVKIQTAENDTSLYLNDSLIQMWEDDLVRFQAGKDATGEYGLYIWNSEGKIMFDATGATSDGIGAEVIVNDMVANDANIAGYKLDIASVAERLNEDGSLTIEAAQVTINGSTLDAWYAEVTETTTELGTNMSVLETQFTVVQGQVDTVVSQTEILEGEVTSLSDQYAEIVVNVDSVTTQVKDLSSDYDTLTGEYTNLTSQVASIETTVNQVNITVSSLTSDYSALAENVASLVTTTDSITASVASLEEQIEGLEGVSEESIIEILKNNITLQTTSSVNGTASIILSVDGTDVGESEVVTKAAEAFADEMNSDKSSITITAGTITLAGGIIQTENGTFTVDQDGNVTMNDVYVGGNSTFNGVIYAREIHLLDTNAYLTFGSAVTDPEWDSIAPIIIGYDTGYVDDICTNLVIGNDGLHLESFVISKYGSDGYPVANTSWQSTFEINPSNFNISNMPGDGQTSQFKMSEDGIELTYSIEGVTSASSKSFSASIYNGSVTINAPSVSISAKSDISISSSSNFTISSSNITVRTSGAMVEVKNSTSSSSTYIMANASWAGYKISLEVGSGGSNRGLYDNTDGAWIIYKDSSSKIHINGESLTYSGTTYGYRVGNMVWISVYGISASTATSMLNGIGVSPRRTCSFPLIFLNGNTGYMYVGYAYYSSSSWTIMVAPSYAGSPAKGSNYSGNFYGVISFTLS